MLAKKNRADKKAVERIFKAFPPAGREGRMLNSPNLGFRFLLSENSQPPRISFIAPKIISKKAVERNLLRRRGYSVLKKYINTFPGGLLGVFIFKKYQDDILILENEIKNIRNQVN